MKIWLRLKTHYLYVAKKKNINILYYTVFIDQNDFYTDSEERLLLADRARCIKVPVSGDTHAVIGTVFFLYLFVYLFFFYLYASCIFSEVVFRLNFSVNYILMRLYFYHHLKYLLILIYIHIPNNYL